MSILYEIVAVDWNGQSLDGDPFKFVGRVSTVDGRSTIDSTTPETNEEHVALVDKLRKAIVKSQLAITSYGGSDYAQFEVVDPEFNSGKGVIYGPGDYLMVLGDSLTVWLPKAAGVLFGKGVQ